MRALARWFSRRKPIAKPYVPGSLVTPAHRLYACGDGEGLIASLPKLPLHEFVPMATALGRYTEAHGALSQRAPIFLQPELAASDDGTLILRINAAETLSELGRFAEARALVSQPAANPYVETGRRTTLAWVLTLEGRAEEAAAHLRGLDASSLGADYAAELHLTVAFVMMVLGRLEATKVALLEARSTAIRSSSVRNLLGLEAELAWKRGERTEALRLFETAAEHHWRWQGGHGLLRWGELLAEVGRTEEARAAWARCVAQDPESIAASLAKLRLPAT